MTTLKRTIIICFIALLTGLNASMAEANLQTEATSVYKWQDNQIFFNVRFYTHSSLTRYLVTGAKIRVEAFDTKTGERFLNNVSTYDGAQIVVYYGGDKVVPFNPRFAELGTRNNASFKITVEDVYYEILRR